MLVVLKGMIEEDQSWKSNVNVPLHMKKDTAPVQKYRVIDVQTY